MLHKTRLRLSNLAQNYDGSSGRASRGYVPCQCVLEFGLGARVLLLQTPTDAELIPAVFLRHTLSADMHVSFARQANRPSWAMYRENGWMSSNFKKGLNDV